MALRSTVRAVRSRVTRALRATRARARGLRGEPRPGRRRLLRDAVELRKRGEFEAATPLAREALELKPDDGATTRELIRCLHGTARSPEDLDEAATLLWTRIDGEQRPSDIRLAVDHSILLLRLGGELDDAFAPMRHIAADDAENGSTSVRRFLTYLVDSGAESAAAACLDELRTVSADPAYTVALQQLRLRQGQLDDVAKLTNELSNVLDVDDPTAECIQADVCLWRGDAAGAEAALREIRPLYSKVHSARLVAAWMATGRHDRIIEHLEQTRSGYTPVERAALLFDANWALGHRAGAASALAALAELAPDDATYISRLEQHDGPEAAAEVRERSMNEIGAGTDDSIVLRAVRAAADANQPQRMIDIMDSASLEGGLGPSLRYERARALYALRRFDDATAEVVALDGSNQTWAALKLHARILLETGRFEEAERDRRTGQRAGDGHDEVLYHALLAQGKWTEAFTMDPIEVQLRTVQTMFPVRAERHPTGHTAHRFVIADAGPGDEVQDASLFGELRQLSERLTVTCDPRLHSLLSRSMPDIEFLPVGRLRTGEFGSHAPGEPARAPNALCDLLTAEAYEVAAQSDRVVLGRAVKTVRDLATGPAPVGPYLQPDPERAEAFRGRLAGDDRPAIGVVWRSELHNLMRDIHYLDVTDIMPLFDTGARIVCLQHDIDPLERRTIEQGGQDNLVDVGEVDLRNDFESVAGLLASLDLVVGIGTTMTNLAAAVGTPTLLVQPTHFGSWLATGPENRNFWYETCEVVVADPPTDRQQLVRRLADRAATFIGATPAAAGRREAERPA